MLTYIRRIETFSLRLTIHWPSRFLDYGTKNPLEISADQNVQKFEAKYAPMWCVRLKTFEGKARLYCKSNFLAVQSPMIPRFEYPCNCQYLLTQYDTPSKLKTSGFAKTQFESEDVVVEDPSEDNGHTVEQPCSFGQLFSASITRTRSQRRTSQNIHRQNGFDLPVRPVNPMPCMGFTGRTGRSNPFCRWIFCDVRR